MTNKEIDIDNAEMYYKVIKFRREKVNDSSKFKAICLYKCYKIAERFNKILDMSIMLSDQDGNNFINDLVTMRISVKYQNVEQ